jgi:hypothetical protein
MAKQTKQPTDEEKRGEGKSRKEQKRPNPVQIQKYLSGIDYPADKKTLLEQARKHGADEAVIDILNELPEKTYNTPKDVSRAIGEVE